MSCFLLFFKKLQHSLLYSKYLCHYTVLNKSSLLVNRQLWIPGLGRPRGLHLILSFIAYSRNKDTLESFILLFFYHNC